MTMIVMTYEGKCEGGPWHGQQINAERGIIRDSLLGGGAYRWRNGKWIWRSQADLAAGD